MKQSPLKFLGSLVALSLPFWLWGSIAPNSLLPFGLPISALMFVCPMLAALILTARQGGWRATRKLCGRAFDMRRIKDKRWLLLSALIMPVVTLLSWLVMRYLHYPLPAPSVALAAIPMMVLVYFIGAIGEELGWMGYLIDPLQEQMNAFSAALIIGVAWEAWHIIPFLAQGRSVGWVIAQSTAGIMMRIIMVWLYNKANKSVFIAVVFHTFINVSFSVFPNQGSHYDPVITASVLTVIVVAWGVGSTSATRHGVP